MARPKKVEVPEGKSEAYTGVYTAVTNALGKLLTGIDGSDANLINDIETSAADAFDAWQLGLRDNFAPEGQEWAVTYTASGRTIPLVRFPTKAGALDWIKTNVRPAAADLYGTVLVDQVEAEATAVEAVEG